MTRIAILSVAFMTGISLCASPSANAFSRQTLKVAREAARVQSEAARATGVKVPIELVFDRTINAAATKNRVEVNTGVPVALVKGATFHEIGHVLLGHNSFRSRVGVRQAEREADFAAGYLLAQSGHGLGKYARAYLRFMSQAGDRDHGTSASRVSATLDGIVDGLLALSRRHDR